MSILSHDTFWNAVITMPMTKKMLQLSLKKCGSCGRTVLEAALDDYAGKAETKCDKCSGLYSQVIGFWVEFLRKGLGFKREKAEKLLGDRYARVAVLNLVAHLLILALKNPCRFLRRFWLFGISLISAISSVSTATPTAVRFRGRIIHRTGIGGCRPACGCWRDGVGV